MNNFEQKVLEKLEEIKELLKSKKTNKLQFEEHNFKVNSDGWKKITVGEKEYLENPEKDIWELNDGEYKGEQLFTWDAMERETKKAGKRVPTDDEFTELLKVKSDMPNLVFAGYRYTAGSFGGLSSGTNFWSSLQSGTSAWDRTLDSGDATVYRSLNSKAYGFSVRCLKN